MTRRLTISILLTLWAILLAGGGLAYFTTRAILVDNLDQTLLAHALITAKSAYPADYPDLPAGSAARIYMLDARRLVATQHGVAAPQILHASFTENRLRTMTVRAYYSPAGDYHDILVSLPADRFDRYIGTLAWTLGGFVLVTGIAVTALAGRIVRSALRPLTTTADTIGGIDEKRLDRRIDVAALPAELRPMAQRLNEMLERLEGSFAARRQFLADASHELRTPVAALVTSLEVALLRQRDPARYVEILQQALVDAEYLQHLSEGLLSTVRAERPNPDAFSPVDVAALLNGCCDLLSPLARQRGVSLYRDLAPGVVIASDEQRLKSVMINLISNAIDYNRPGGSVQVSCRNGEPGVLPPPVTAAPHAGSLAVMQIRDTGIGIASEDLPRIFDPFARIDKARTMAAPGPMEKHGDNEMKPVAAHLGLGLALVKRHVEALGGSLYVASKLGEGTAFTLLVDALQVANVERRTEQIAARS